MLRDAFPDDLLVDPPLELPSLLEGDQAGAEGDVQTVHAAYHRRPDAKVIHRQSRTWCDSGPGKDDDGHEIPEAASCQIRGVT